jgi:hypothetical protein
VRLPASQLQESFPKGGLKNGSYFLCENSDSRSVFIYDFQGIFHLLESSIRRESCCFRIVPPGHNSQIYYLN